ncbi:ATP-binding protein [Pseudonocardia saturnea]
MYEALANAAEHAYAGSETGPVHLEARRGATTIHVTVSDEGRWRTGRTGPFRGRGLHTIRTLLDAVHVIRGARGTRIEMCNAVGPVR